MATNRVWNLMYYLGSSDQIRADEGNPLTRKAAISGADLISNRGQRAWVEHRETRKRIYDSHDGNLEERAERKG